MKNVVLDFTGCSHWSEIHRIIKESFDFPDYYGENLSALWDCMCDYCDNMHVYIKGLNTLTQDYYEYMIKILEVFDDVHQENPGFTFEIIQVNALQSKISDDLE